MKRDMELIRTILLNVESDKYQYGERVHVDDVSSEACAYHVALMIDSGLVEGTVLKSVGSPYVGATITRLTSAGHDFCDGIREDTIWKKTKEHVLKPGASYTLSVVIEYVKLQVHKKIFGS